MIHLALDDLPDWRAGAELQRFAYVHVAPDLEMMARVYAEASAGLLPAEPVLVVGQPTAIDPTRAPEGKHVLWVQVRVLPAEIVATPRRNRCQDMGRGQGAVCRARARHPGGLRAGVAQRILGQAVFSPMDLERENPNLIGGDNLSGSHHLDQNFFLRPVAG